ncbi:MAG: hypothetical protein RRZ64_05435 [Rikenellaceae bacterium]
MGKITVKHYLNTRGVPLIFTGTNDSREYYSIYIQITQNRKTTQIKSFLYVMSTVQGFEDYLKNGVFNDDEIFTFEKEDVNKLLENEARNIVYSIKFIIDNKIDISQNGFDLRDVLSSLFEPARKVLISYFPVWAMSEDMEKSDFKLYNTLNPNNTLSENIKKIKKLTKVNLSSFVDKRYLDLSKDLDAFLKQIGCINYIELVNHDIIMDIISAKIKNIDVILEYIKMAIDVHMLEYENDIK